MLVEKVLQDTNIAEIQEPNTAFSFSLFHVKYLCLGLSPCGHLFASDVI